MKIALINENSQAAKNEMICATLKKVVEPMGHEVFNYGMCGAEDPNSLTYVQNGILAAVLFELRGQRISLSPDAEPAKVPCLHAIPSPRFCVDTLSPLWMLTCSLR